MCAGVWERGLAAARVSPATNRTAALTPALLGYIGRYLLRHGQVVFEIRIVRGGVVLAPASTWQVFGGPDPATWEWELDFQGPSYRHRKRLAAPRVLNLTYAVDSGAPWQGVSPLNAGGVTNSLLASLETALAREANTATAYLAPVPDTKQAGTLQSDIRGADGKLLLVDSVHSDAAWGLGQESKQPGDWDIKRAGANPPMPLIDLRSRAELSVLAAAGVGVTLLSQSDGTAKREDYRRFLHGTLQPVGRILADQLGAALGQPGIAFDFSQLSAADLAGRARAYGIMTGAGVSVADAAEIAQLPIEDGGRNDA